MVRNGSVACGFETAPCIVRQSMGNMANYSFPTKGGIRARLCYWPLRKGNAVVTFRRASECVINLVAHDHLSEQSQVREKRAVQLSIRVAQPNNAIDVAIRIQK
jgi:hypothetical protein